MGGRPVPAPGRCEFGPAEETGWLRLPAPFVLRSLLSSLLSTAYLHTGRWPEAVLHPLQSFSPSCIVSIAQLAAC